MYRKTILENGIRVVTEKVPEMRSIAIGIMVDAGPQDETPEQSGLAHLVEHLIFQGTGSRDAKQIGRFMDSAGGNFGAFTTRDYTIFYATVLDDHRTYALELLGDIFLNSIFPAENLEIEKNAILQEIELGRDSPEERLNTLLKTHSWSSHPLGRPTAGNPEILKGLTREDAIYFFYENYLPDRIIISASGNVDHDDFVAQVRDSFWRMLGTSPPRIRTPLVHQGGVIIEHMPVSQVYFSVGLQAHPYADPDRYGMHILNNILGGGISSRLFRRIRDQRGMVFQIGSEYHAYRDGGMLVIEGSTTPDFLMPVLGLTMIELWRLITNDDPIDDEELWKSKMQIKGQHIISGENTNTRMSRLSTQEFYFGKHIPSNQILEQIEAVDRSLFQRMADDMLMDAAKHATIAIVGPERPESYSTASIEELLADFQ